MPNGTLTIIGQMSLIMTSYFTTTKLLYDTSSLKFKIKIDKSSIPKIKHQKCTFRKLASHYICPFAII